MQEEKFFCRHWIEFDKFWKFIHGCISLKKKKKKKKSQDIPNDLKFLFFVFKISKEVHNHHDKFDILEGLGGFYWQVNLLNM